MTQSDVSARQTIDPPVQACGFSRYVVNLGARWLILAGAFWVSSDAQAETLRCSGGIVDEGDSSISLLYKCGQPLLRESFCAPVYYNGNPNPLPQPFANAVIPCLQTDDWLYDRGPGNLPATVRVRSGAVVTIRHSRELR